MDEAAGAYGGVALRGLVLPLPSVGGCECSEHVQIGWVWQLGEGHFSGVQDPPRDSKAHVQGPR